MNVFHSFCLAFSLPYNFTSSSKLFGLYGARGAGHIFGVFSFLFIKLTLVEGFVMTHKFINRSITTMAGQQHHKRYINEILLKNVFVTSVLFSEDKK